MTDKANLDLAATSHWLQRVKQNPIKKRYKLLIVDDQPEIRNLLALTLSADNYDVHHANDWVSALAMTRAIKPDLILLDVMMPGELDGFEICRRIKEDQELSNAIVIIISGRAQLADRYQGLDSGADDYLPKPFSPLSLIDKVNLLLARKEHQF